MKNMKKIIAVLMSLSAITMTTSAFAATTGTGTATYTEGAVKLVTEQLPSDANTQLTVVIVPANLGADAITSQNIYYINQGAAGEEFKAIIADMKVKDGADFATKTYEVRIGGALANDYYVYEITGKALEEIMYGDANSDNKLEAFDASLILQKCAGWDIKINETAADANADGKLEAFDASLVLQKCAGWDIVLGPKAE